MNDARLTNWLAEQELRAAWLRRNSEIVKQKAPCDCAECRMKNGKRRESMPALHDCFYTAARANLIPQASRIATEQVGDGSDMCVWTKVFVEAMERLVTEHGLYQSNNGNGAHDNGAHDGTREVQAAQKSPMAVFWLPIAPAE